MRALTGFLIVLLLFGIRPAEGLAQAFPQLPVPVPPDLKVVPPSADIPQDRAALSGIWVGKWGNLDTALVVEELTASGARVVYAWGTNANVPRAGWTRHNAEFAGSDLRFTVSNGTFSYRMRPDGKLDAVAQLQQVNRAILSRVYPAEASSQSQPAAQQPAPSVAARPTALRVNVSLPVPMPPDLQILLPTPDVPAERAAFSGVWVGKWDNIQDAVIAVDGITATRVSVVYGWGVAPQWNVNQAGSVRPARVEFVGGALRLTTDYFPIVLRMRSDGRLDGEVQGSQLRAQSIFMKVFPRPGSEAPSAPAAQQPAAQPQIASCLTEQVTFRSGPLLLKGTIMRPKEDGRHPVVIFNHGSRFQFQGGSVASFESNPIVADGTPCPSFVAGKRWVLFIPWRRGYGGSQGDRYSDVITRPGTSVTDAAVRRLKGVEADDVNAGYEYVKSQPFADGTRIAVTGASLGGIVSMFAAGKNPTAYRGVVDQAGAWSQGYEPLVQELVQAGRNIQAPILLQHGTQDQIAPLAASRQVADELSRLGRKVTLRTYSIAHSFNIFGSDEVWLADFVGFLEENLK